MSEKVKEIKEFNMKDFMASLKDIIDDWCCGCAYKSGVNKCKPSASCELVEKLKDFERELEDIF